MATAQGEPYRVFTPFWKACSRSIEQLPHAIAPRPRRLLAWRMRSRVRSTPDLQLNGGSAGPPGLTATWTPGERGAQVGTRTLSQELRVDYAAGPQSPGPGRHVAPLSLPALRRAFTAAIPRATAPREERPMRPAHEPSSASSAGASSRITCCTTFRNARPTARRALRRASPWANDRSAAAGMAARPDRVFRSSTPACASCGTRAGCTTACA